MNSTFITPEIKKMIGEETTFTSSEELSLSTIRRFAAAIGDRSPLYWDEEFARKSRWGGIIAPPTLIFELNFNTGGEIDEEGGYEQIIKLPPPLNRTIRAGNEYEIFQPARPGDLITIKRRIADIYEKEGKRGKLVFLICEMTYINQKGEILGINREPLVYLPSEEVKERK